MPLSVPPTFSSNIFRIDQCGVIKVADFGLTKNVYTRNYFRHDKSEEGSEEKLPIRWMAPESIENDIYNEESDVVGDISVGCCITNQCLVLSGVLMLHHRSMHILISNKYWHILRVNVYICELLWMSLMSIYGYLIYICGLH